MDTEDLEVKIKEAQQAGKEPLAVIGTSGSTVRGAFDNCHEISRITKKHDIWFHVDAAWGGGVLFSPTHRTLMDGADLADSLCWDQHKMMGVPQICSAFLIKDLKLLFDVCQHGRTAHYLIHNSLDLAHRSLQCGRVNDTLKLWLAWKERGDEGFAQLTDRFNELADYMEMKVREHPRLEMMSERKFQNICCRFNPTPGVVSDVNLNELNIKIRNTLTDSGKFMISRSNIKDDVILRPVTCGPDITEELIDELLAEIVTLGEQYSANN